VRIASAATHKLSPGGGSDRLVGQLAAGSLRRIRPMPERISARTTAGDSRCHDFSRVFIVFTHVKQKATAKPAINTEKIVLAVHRAVVQAAYGPTGWRSYARGTR